MNWLKHIVVSLISMAAMATLSLAQWPGDPSNNLILSDRPSEQATPKIVATSDGGCYVTWYDLSSGNYNMTMQRLNGAGEVMWEDCGLLISDHPQDSWITDYSLAVDGSDNAVVVFNDIRAGNDWDIYAYKISPSGQFLWGPDGIIISDNTDDELGPVATVASNNDVIIAWPRATDIPDRFYVDIKRLTPDGNDAWQNPSTIELAPEYGLSIIRLVPADDGSVILQALEGLDYGFGCPKNLCAYKIAQNGNQLWSDTGVVISDQGGFLPHMMPHLTSDGAGGAYSYWYDGRIGQQACYVQHILSDGSMAWQINGLPVSTSLDYLYMEPVLIRVPNGDNIMLFYFVTDLDQHYGGIGGQLFNPAGERIWSDTGLVFVPFSLQQCMNVNALPEEEGGVFTYIEYIPGSVENSTVKAMRVNTHGEQIWSASPETLCTVTSPHAFLRSAVSPIGQVISVWLDARSERAGDIYLQNVNPDGSFGPYTSIDDRHPRTPDQFQAFGNYPNPFNPATTISYVLPKSSKVKIEVMDILGRKIETLLDEKQAAGVHQINWNASGRSSGTYLYKIKTESSSETRRMTYLK